MLALIKTANHNKCRLLCHLLLILKVIFANSVDPDQTAPLGAVSDQGPHCLPVCKNRFEKFARIFSRWHKQTIFSDAGFLGILRVRWSSFIANIFLYAYAAMPSINTMYCLHACLCILQVIHWEPLTTIDGVLYIKEETALLVILFFLVLFFYIFHIPSILLQSF